MNKFKFYLIASFAALNLISCQKDDDNEILTETLRDFSQQYNTDTAIIKDYLKTHYVKEVVDAPGESRDQDIVIDSILPGNPNNVTSIWNDARLDSVIVDLHDIKYNLYYFKARVGSGESPTRVDQALFAYDGYYLRYENRTVNKLDESGNPIIGTDGLPVKETRSFLKSNPFQYVPFPSGYFELDRVITSWSEIMRLFKEGTIAASGEGQPNIYNDFGAGILFAPSGLGYYNIAQSNIPSYVPLMFTFKLYDTKRADHDGDGINSADEDLNRDGFFSNDDSDGDGIQNYLDVDDDNDAYTTKSEIMIPDSSPAAYYPYNPTTEQPLGVPNCSGDFTTPDRLRKYLDPSCH